MEAAMRIKLKELTALICFAGLFLFVQAPGFSSASGVPKAVLGQKAYDFGTVYEGKYVIHGFTVKNAGDAPLDIEKVRTG